MAEIKLSKTQLMGMNLLQQVMQKQINDFLTEVVLEAGEDPKKNWALDKDKLVSPEDHNCSEEK